LYPPYGCQVSITILHNSSTDIRTHSAFASAMKLSPSKSSLTVSALNGKYLGNYILHTFPSIDLESNPGAEVIARLAAGVLSDRWDPWLLSFSTLLGTCIATFVLWGVLSHSLAGLIAFGLVYGSFAGGWCSIWMGFIRQIVRELTK
jgi:MFS transporter, MCT family, solute carrier family 16 (monocarboxylic acid transporters), member 10